MILVMKCKNNKIRFSIAEIRKGAEIRREILHQRQKTALPSHHPIYQELKISLSVSLHL